MRKALLLISLLALLSMMAFAADVAGAWKGTIETPVGNQDLSLNLKLDGENVTGTMASTGGEVKIEKAKLDGDKISFEVQSEYGPLAYSGTVLGDEMNLKISVMGMELPVVLKRAK